MQEEYPYNALLTDVIESVHEFIYFLAVRLEPLCSFQCFSHVNLLWGRQEWQNCVNDIKTAKGCQVWRTRLSEICWLCQTCWKNIGRTLRLRTDKSSTVPPNMGLLTKSDSSASFYLWVSVCAILQSAPVNIEAVTDKDNRWMGSL